MLAGRLRPSAPRRRCGQPERAQVGGTDLPGDGAELVGTGACGVALAGGEHDLDERSQHLSASDRADGLVRHPADRRNRGIDLSLSQPQQRQARLRLAPGVRGGPVRLLSMLQVATQALQLGESVQGVAGSRRPREALARSVGLLDGVLPVTVQLHDLGAVHEALTAERHQIGLRVAPTTERSGPLRRPAHIEHRLASIDCSAQDGPGDDRRHLAGRDGDHRLVEQRASPRRSAPRAISA